MRTLEYPSQEVLMPMFDYDWNTGHLIRKEATKGYPAGRRITRVNHSGYIVTTIGEKCYRVHHLVWIWHYGIQVNELDHINRIKNDNRIENLRVCDKHVSNCGNSAPRKHKYKGVTFCKATGKWRAQICPDGGHVCLGRHSTIEAAALAYNEAAKEYFGEFAYLNEVPNANP